MKKKIMVVDDSLFMRMVLSDMIRKFGNYDVDSFVNGFEALEALKKKTYDVIFLDIEMPVLDGISTLERIVSKYNTPVIMFSSLTIEGASHTIKALELGAFDFIPKPTNLSEVKKDDSIKNIKDALNSALYRNAQKKAETVNVVELKNKNLNKTIMSSSSVATVTKKILEFSGLSVVNEPKKKTGKNKLIAVATSTGGPLSLQKVIPKLPKNIDAPIVLVQHMPKGFTKTMAQRLDSISQINVKEAEDGDLLEKGTCYVAPGGYQMRIIEKSGKLYIRISDEGPYNGHKPAADIMYESLTFLKLYDIMGVIMTGMGSDGTEGLKKLYAQGHTVIAQDAESCVVFGMPKAVIKTGCVNVIAPLDEIAGQICKYL